MSNGGFSLLRSSGRIGPVLLLLLVVLQPLGLRAQKPTVVERRCPGANPDTSNPMCQFLGENYDEMRARCGLLVSNRWKPQYWFKPYHQVDAVPTAVLYGVDKSAFGTDKWIPTDRNSMIRLLSYAGCDPSAAAGCGVLDGQILTLSEARSVGQTLTLDPLLSPDIALVKGVTSVVQTMSCSDVLAAAESAKVGVSVASANQKITTRDTSSNNYKLVYGLFQSPMTFLKNAPSPQTYYFVAADWYLRHLQPRDAGGHIPSPDSPNPPKYIAAARAAVVYDEYATQGSSSIDVSGSGQYSTPVASVEASASYQDTTQSNQANHQFRALIDISNLEDDSLPSWRETASYFASGQVAIVAVVPAFDATSNTVKTTVAIEGMPASLCKPGVWVANSHSNTEGSCTDSGTAGTSFSLISAQRFIAPVGTAGTLAAANTSKGQCRFVLERTLAPLGLDLALDGSFTGSLRPNRDQPDTPPPCAIAIPVSIPGTFDAPKVTLFSAPAPVTAAGAFPPSSFWYQLAPDTYIDKGVPPVPTVAITCANATTPNPAITAATFQSAAPVPGSSSTTTVKGSFLQLQFANTASAGVSTSSPATCTAAGTVKFALLGGSSPVVVTVK